MLLTKTDGPMTKLYFGTFLILEIAVFDPYTAWMGTAEEHGSELSTQTNLP